MKKELLLIIVLSLFVCVLGFASENPKLDKSRTLILSGKITDLHNNESLVGVKIACAACNKTVYSDLDGNFLLYLELASDTDLTLEFSQIGYNTELFKLEEFQSNDSNLSINLTAE